MVSVWSTVQCFDLTALQPAQGQTQTQDACWGMSCLEHFTVPTLSLSSEDAHSLRTANLDCSHFQLKYISILNMIFYNKHMLRTNITKPYTEINNLKAQLIYLQVPILKLRSSCLWPWTWLPKFYTHYSIIICYSIITSVGWQKLEYILLNESMSISLKFITQYFSPSYLKFHSIITKTCWLWDELTYNQFLS